MSDIGGSELPTLDRAGALAISELIYHIVGTTPTYVEKPLEEDGGAKFLFLFADRGNWRIRTGDDYSGAMPGTEFPSATELVNGTGGLLLREGAGLLISAPANFTVKGYAANSVLTFYWM